MLKLVKCNYCIQMGVLFLSSCYGTHRKQNLEMKELLKLTIQEMNYFWKLTSCFQWKMRNMTILPASVGDSKL